MKATILKPGDKVRLLDNAFTQLPGAKDLAEAKLYVGVLTVQSAEFVPVNDIQDFQDVMFEEIPYSVGNTDCELVPVKHLHITRLIKPVGNKRR